MLDGCRVTLQRSPSAGANGMAELVLFHGTTTRRLQEIQRENRLRAGAMGRVSLTTDRTVAEYFGYNCVYGERRRLLGEDIEGAAQV